MNVAKRYMSGISLITDYEASWWRSDILAALSLWAVLIPHTVAYAQLAGVAPCTACTRRS